MKKILASLLLTAVVLGCGLRLKHASPSELGALPDADKARLATYEDDRLREAAAWQFAKREAEIAAAELASTEVKRGAAKHVARWARHEVDVARMRMANDREAALNYCRQRFTALSDLHDFERQRAKARLAAAKAQESEARRRYALAVAEQERARMAIVTDRPGFLKEDRDKIMARWNEAVTKAKKNSDKAMIERRQLETRASDNDKALQGHIAGFLGRFAAPCDIDWQLPAAVDSRPAAGDVQPLRPRNPLTADDNDDETETPTKIDVPKTKLLPPRMEIFSAPSTQATPLTEAVESPLLSD